MDDEVPRTPLDRRSLLTRLGGVGTALAIGGALPGRAASVAAQAEPTPAPASTWTPPPLPQPLPEPGGTPPPLVGAAPPEPVPPASGAPTSIENPQAASTPAAAGAGDASPAAGGEIAVTNPQQPAQPLATPDTGDDEGPPPAATVTLTPDFRFDPPEVTVRVGEAVEWTNAGRAPQTVTCDPARARDKTRPTVPAGAQPWDSGVLNSGDTFNQVFAAPGAYVYFSMPQEEAGMIGRVIVQP